MKKDDIKRVAIYARTSTDTQREKKTIDAQVSELTAYAKQQDYPLMQVYKDDGVSGASIEARSAFKQFLQDCVKRKFEAVLVSEHSRLTRSDNPEERGRIDRILMENNIRIISPLEGILDLRQSTDEFMAYVKGWTSKEERKWITERMKRGKRDGLKKGRWTGGPPPFGYRWNKEQERWSIVEEERQRYLEFVEKIEEGWSINHIVRDLQERKIKNKRGKDWTNRAVHYMLRSSSYKGTVFCNRFLYQYDRNTGKVKNVGERPRDEWILLKIPPMIPPSRWKKVQKLIDLNRNTGRPTTGDYLLKGLLECGHCGAALNLQRGSRRKDCYYVCHNRRSAKHQRSTKNRERCVLPYLPTRKLDHLVFSYVAFLLADPDFILDRLLSEEARQKDLKELAKKAQQLEKELQRHEHRKARLLDLYMDSTAKDRILYDKKRFEEDDQIKQLEEKLAQVKIEIEQTAQTQEKIQTAKKRLRKLKGKVGAALTFYLHDKVNEIDFDTKRRLLEGFFRPEDQRITVTRAEGLSSKEVHLPVNFEWNGVFDFDRWATIAQQLKLGKPLKKALDQADKSILKDRKSFQQLCR